MIKCLGLAVPKLQERNSVLRRRIRARFRLLEWVLTAISAKDARTTRKIYTFLKYDDRRRVAAFMCWVL